jgi:thiamine biosynthesis protein ThiI
LRVLLYWRLMVRVAEELLRCEDGKALMTGESVEQVALQTLEALTVVEDGAQVPRTAPADRDGQAGDRGSDAADPHFRAFAATGRRLLPVPEPHQGVTRRRLQETLKAEAAIDMDRLVEASGASRPRRRFWTAAVWQ